MPGQNINSDLIRGHIDSIILRILRDGDNYGYEIMKAVLKNSDNEYELKEPSLYTSLKRLEKQGHIVSYWGDASQGGRRKYYRITDSGLFEALPLNDISKKYEIDSQNCALTVSYLDTDRLNDAEFVGQFFIPAGSGSSDGLQAFDGCPEGQIPCLLGCFRFDIPLPGAGYLDSDFQSTGVTTGLPS